MLFELLWDDKSWITKEKLWQLYIGEWLCHGDCLLKLSWYQTLQFFTSYDTAVEQIAIIKQLMELYIVEEEEFEYGSSMLELAIALSYHGELAEDSNKWVKEMNITLINVWWHDLWSVLKERMPQSFYNVTV